MYVKLIECTFSKKTLKDCTCSFEGMHSISNLIGMIWELHIEQ